MEVDLKLLDEQLNHFQAAMLCGEKNRWQSFCSLLPRVVTANCKSSDSDKFRYQSEQAQPHDDRQKVV